MRLGTKEKRNHEILHLYAVVGKKQTWIAKRFDITTSRVNQICRTQRIKELTARLTEDLAEARLAYQSDLRSVIDKAEIKYRQEIQKAIARYEKEIIYGKPQVGIPEKDTLLGEVRHVLAEKDLPENRDLTEDQLDIIYGRKEGTWEE